MDPTSPHPQLGAVAVGARRPLRRGELLARRPRPGAGARARRQRRCASATAGSPGVRALGLARAERRRDSGVDEPGRPRALRDSRPRAPRCAVAVEAAGRHGSRGSNWSGLVPAAELARCIGRLPGLGRPRPRRHDRGPPRDMTPPSWTSDARTRSGGGDAAAFERRVGAGPGAAPAPTGRPRSRTSRRAGARIQLALDPNFAAAAHGLGFPGRRTPLREEQIRINPQTVGAALRARALLPPPVPSGFKNLIDLLNLHRHPPLLDLTPGATNDAAGITTVSL